jgi:hypothetical protein
MNSISRRTWILLVFACSFMYVSCDKDNSSSNQFGIFTVLSDSVTIEMDGTINRNSLENFNELVDNYPNVNQINIVNCDGSSDDEVNLQLSLKVHQMQINTHILDNGIIASGGTDFFLAGKDRTKGANTQIGVHSWSDGNNEATDFPNGHEFHLPYINYYQSIGFTQQQAEDFYYFTINAAPAESIHWMTTEEISQYGILTP